MPVASLNTPDPNPVLTVVVMDTALRPASTAETCDVPASDGGGALAAAGPHRPP